MFGSRGSFTGSSEWGTGSQWGNQDFGGFFAEGGYRDSLDDSSDAVHVRIAGNTWFFPEGQAQRYAPAKYGELRVDDHGEALLTGLRDDRRAPL